MLREGSKVLVRDILQLIDEIHSSNFNGGPHYGLLLDLGMAVEGNVPGIKPVKHNLTNKDVISIYLSVCQVRYGISKSKIVRISKERFGADIPFVNKKLKEHMMSYQIL